MEEEKKGPEEKKKDSNFFLGFLAGIALLFLVLVSYRHVVESPGLIYKLPVSLGNVYERILSWEIARENTNSINAAASKINFKAEMARRQFSKKYDTTAAWQLNTEYDAYPSLSQRHYDIVDGAIDRVKMKILETKGWEGLHEDRRAAVILSTIFNYIQPYRTNSSAKGDKLLSRGLDKKDLECDTASVIYLAVGEVLKLPIVLVAIPTTKNGNGHVFVRWNFADGSHIDWEATSQTLENAPRSEQDFQRDLGKEKLKLDFIVMDSQAYREDWKAQLRFAYPGKDTESFVKSTTIFGDLKTN